MWTTKYDHNIRMFKHVFAQFFFFFTPSCVVCWWRCEIKYLSDSIWNCWKNYSTFIDIVEQKLVKDDEKGPSWAIYFKQKEQTVVSIVRILCNPRLVSWSRPWVFYLRFSKRTFYILSDKTWAYSRIKCIQLNPPIDLVLVTEAIKYGVYLSYSDYQSHSKR